MSCLHQCSQWGAREDTHSLILTSVWWHVLGGILQQAAHRGQSKDRDLTPGLHTAPCELAAIDLGWCIIDVFVIATSWKEL